MIQKQVRHLLVVKDDDATKPLGIITTSDFAYCLKQKLKSDGANTKIVESLKEMDESLKEIETY